MEAREIFSDSLLFPSLFLPNLSLPNAALKTWHFRFYWVKEMREENPRVICTYHTELTMRVAVNYENDTSSTSYSFFFPGGWVWLALAGAGINLALHWATLTAPPTN